MTTHSIPTVAGSQFQSTVDAGQDIESAVPIILRVPQWTKEEWLLHGFSTRLGGVSELAGHEGNGELNLGYTVNDKAEAVSVNRRRFLDRVTESIPQSEPSPGVVTLKQMHSSVIRRVGPEDVAECPSLWGDGLMTDEPGVLLGIQTADCLPILVADRKRRAVAAFHAGWRGTLKGIVERGIASMAVEFHSKPDDLIAAIGPGIGRCCFTVGAEVVDLFAAKFIYADKLILRGEGLRLDLIEANRQQLIAAGVRESSIFSWNACTSCENDRFFSYRAERGNTGRLMAAIGVTP